MNEKTSANLTPNALGYEEFIESTMKAVARALEARSGQSTIRPAIGSHGGRFPHTVVVGIVIDPGGGSVPPAES